MPAFETDQLVFIPEEYTEYPDNIRTDISKVSANIHNSKMYQLLNFISLFLLGVHSISSNILPQISLHTELSMLAGVNMFLCIMFYTERNFNINILKKLILQNYSDNILSNIVINISIILLVYSTVLFAISLELTHLASIVIYLSSLIGFLLHLSLDRVHSITTESISTLLSKKDIENLESEYTLTKDGKIHKIEGYEFRDDGLLDKLIIFTTPL